MSKQFFFRLAALAASLTMAALAPKVYAGQLLAGAAKVSITTPAEEFPWQSGNEKPFVGVHDEVFVRSLALDDSAGHKALLVSVEVTTIPEPAAFVAALAEATGLPASSIVLLATHTHSVPLVFFHSAQPNPAERREIDRIRTAAVRAARQALAQLQPATFNFVRAQAYVNTNNGEQGGRKDWYDPAGSSDKTLDLLRVDSMDGKPLGLLLNYANHAEVMFRSVTRNGGYEVTGDLPGAVSRLLETRPGGVPVALFTSGAEGDQLPLFKSLQPAADFAAGDMGAGGWSLLELQARRLAGAALAALASAPAGVAQVRLSIGASSISCPGQRYQVDRATRQVQGVTPTGPVTIPMAALRLNEVVLASIGADIASDIGVALKRASPSADTSLLTMLAGSVGYVLNDAAYEHPTHGVTGSPVKPGCATAALSQGLQQLLSP
jgi:neutral ceramidase